MVRATMIALSGRSSCAVDEALAGELMQQPVGEIVEIVQPLAQIGLGLALQFGAGVVLHALDRGFGGQAASHRLAQPAQPAAVMREHAEGFQHLAMLARPDVAACSISTSIEWRMASIAVSSRSISRFDVLGDELLDDDARLMQHDMAEADAIGDRRALAAPAAGRSAISSAGQRDRLQFARGDHLGEQHRRRLQRLDLLFGIERGAPCSARRGRRAYCRRAGSARRGRSE